MRVHRQTALQKGWPCHFNFYSIPKHVEGLKDNIQKVIYGAGLFTSPVWNRMPIEILNHLQHNAPSNVDDVHWTRVG